MLWILVIILSCPLFCFFLICHLSLNFDNGGFYCKWVLILFVVKLKDFSVQLLVFVLFGFERVFQNLKSLHRYLFYLTVMALYEVFFLTYSIFVHVEFTFLWISKYLHTVYWIDILLIQWLEILPLSCPSSKHMRFFGTAILYCSTADQIFIVPHK